MPARFREPDELADFSVQFFHRVYQFLSPVPELLAGGIAGLDRDGSLQSPAGEIRNTASALRDAGLCESFVFFLGQPEADESCSSLSERHSFGRVVV